MSTSHQYFRILKCPNDQSKRGSHALVSPHILECKHTLCESCLRQVLDSEDIRCPYDGCKKEILKDSAQPVSTFCEAPMTSGGDQSGAYYPNLECSGDEKLMEPELRHDPDIMIEDSSDDSDCMQDESMSPHSDRLPEFEYTDLANERNANQLPEEQFRDERKWDVEAITRKLCQTDNYLDCIQGFCASHDQNKLYIDIDEGCKDEVTLFLQTRFQQEWASKRIVLVEQESQAEYIIHTGDKISTRINNLQIGSRIDVLSDYGTLTCLGETDRGEQYALTAKHIISVENRPQQGDENIFSGINCKIAHISNHYKGILGGYRFGERDIQVDIAAVRLNESVTQRLDNQLVHTLNDTFKRQDKYLYGVKVRKRGASSGDTTGCIVKYKNNTNNRGQKIITGDEFVIESNDENGFAIEGDSGALVWSTTGIPIGIVSKEQKNYRYYFNGSSHRKNVVFAVRLDHCLEALYREWQINIVKCKSYGAMLPYASRVPPPTIDVIHGAEPMQAAY